MRGAVEQLLQQMDTEEKEFIKVLEERQIFIIKGILGKLIRKQFFFSSGNSELLDDCARVCRVDHISPDDASLLIIKRLWEFLRQKR